MNLGGTSKAITVIQGKNIVGKCDTKGIQRLSFDAELHEAQEHLAEMYKQHHVTTQTETEFLVESDYIDMSGFKISNPTQKSNKEQKKKDIDHDKNKSKETSCKPITDTKDSAENVRTPKCQKNKMEQIRQLLEDELAPEQFLCKSFGIEKSIEGLDSKLSSCVEYTDVLRSIPVLSFESGTAGKGIIL